MPTKRQLCFIEEYLVDLNGTQAAIRAGYAPRAANEQASALLALPNIRARVDAALAERSRRTGITADRVLRELARVAFANAGDLVNLQTAEVRPFTSADDTAAISSVRIKQVPTPEGMGVEREIRLADKNRALELLGKHLGMFADKMKFEGALPVVITGDGELER